MSERRLDDRTPSEIADEIELEAQRRADEAPAPVEVEVPQAEPEIDQDLNDAGKLQLTPAETLALHSLCQGTDVVEVRAMAPTALINLQGVGFIDQDGVPTDAGREYIGSC